jgi:hypothetical protein
MPVDAAEAAVTDATPSYGRARMKSKNPVCSSASAGGTRPERRANKTRPNDQMSAAGSAVAVDERRRTPWRDPILTVRPSLLTRMVARVRLSWRTSPAA